MARKVRAIILDACGDNKRGGARIGRKGGKYFVESMSGESGRYKGQTTRKYMRTKSAAEQRYYESCVYRSFSG